MRKLLFILLFFNVLISYTQIRTFDNEVKKEFPNSFIYNLYQEQGYSYISKVEYHPRLYTKDKIFPLCDSIKSYSGYIENDELHASIFPLMHNLKYLYLERLYINRPLKKGMTPLCFVSKLEELYFDSRLPLLIDIYQFKESLNVLSINIKKKKQEVCNFDFSSFVKLRYLSFHFDKRNNMGVVLPSNLYCLEWSISPEYDTINFSSTIEVLFLNFGKIYIFPPSLFKLNNLRFLSLDNNNKNYEIELTDDFLSLTSLKSLQIPFLTENNIEIISKMNNLDTLYIYNAKIELPPNIEKLKHIKYIEISSCRYKNDYEIVKIMQKYLSNVSIKIKYSFKSSYCGLNYE